MKKKIWYLMAVFLCSLPLQIFAGSLQLVNDSGFTLRAVIQKSDGEVVGDLIIPPKQTVFWNGVWGNPVTTTPTQTDTPYSVTWYCEDGTTYAMANNVPQGGICAAQESNGNRACKRKQRPAEGGSPAPPQGGSPPIPAG